MAQLPTSKVLIKADSLVAIINESDFDGELHERVPDDTEVGKVEKSAETKPAKTKKSKPE